jgi:hypothetical protein
MAMPPHRPRPIGAEPSADEIRALRQVRVGKVIEPEMRQCLIDAGLIEQKLGGMVLTLNGQLWDAVSP